MAILSNINGKFAVDSSGGIQFSGQTGTAGYVLKSNGNAAPTWVAPSAIIGGPYLPLTGGTLTGPLIGTSAAFSGNLSAIAGTFAGNVILSSALPLLYLTNTTASTGKNWRLSSATNGKFFIAQEGVVDALTLDHTSGNATFSNRVTVNGYFQVNSTTRLGGAVTIEGDVFMDGYDITSINELSASTATFTGNVGIGSAPVGNPATKFLAVGTAGSVAGGIQLWATNAQTHYIQFGDAASGGNYYRGAIGYAHASDTLLLLQSGSTALSFTGSQAATFAGNVGIGKAPAKTLDVEGNIRAINTAGSAAAEIDISSGATWRLRSNPTSGTNSYGLDIIKGGAGTDVKMTINSDGDVGIGLITPGAKLDVLQEARVSYAASNQYTLRITNTDGNPRILADGSAAHLIFGTTPSGSATATERMRIQNDGNVGIGTTSPRADSFTRGLTIGNTSDGGAQLVLQENTLTGGWRIFNNGYLGFIANNDERMRITSGGDVLIGTTTNQGIGGVSIDPNSSTPTLTTIVNNTSVTNAELQTFRYNSTLVGSITLNGTTVTQYNTSSDYRLKEDLKDFNGLDKVSKIKMYDYKWKSDESRSYGVMAHELQEVLPQAVSGKKDNINDRGKIKPQQVDYSKIVPLLVKSIQELEARLKILENK